VSLLKRKTCSGMGKTTNTYPDDAVLAVFALVVVIEQLLNCFARHEYFRDKTVLFSGESPKLTHANNQQPENTCKKKKD
jgi:hypothetical protein